MTYQQFRAQNDVAKKCTTRIGRVTDVNYTDNTCVLNVHTKKIKMNIGVLVREIAEDKLSAITNPYLLKRWEYFEK